MPGYEILEQDKNKADDQESLGSVGQQDDEDPIGQALVNFIEGGDNEEGAHGKVAVLIPVDQRKFPGIGSLFLERPGGPFYPVIDGNLGIDDIGKLKDSIELDFYLFLIDDPDAFRQTIDITVFDLVHELFDGFQILVEVRIQLQAGRDQGDQGTEKDDRQGQAPDEAASETDEIK